MHPIGFHLAELRARIGLIALSALGYFIAALVVNDALITWFMGPYCAHLSQPVLAQLSTDPGCALVTTTPFGGLWLRMMVGACFSAMGVVPIGLWQTLLWCWPLIAPNQPIPVRSALGVIVMVWLTWIGLTTQLISPVLVLGTTLSTDGVTPIITASAYCSLVIGIGLGVLVVVLVPLGTWLAIHLKLLSGTQLATHRPFVVIGLLLISAIITPTQDPVTMVIVAMPALIGIEAISIWARYCALTEHKKGQVKLA